MNAEQISISKMIVNGNRLELPKDEQFSNYTKVKKILITAGSKYKKCGFEFKEDAQVIKDCLVGGENINDKKKYQYFPTPEKIARRLVELAEIDSLDCVLEPSAGQGAIANIINDKFPKQITLVELMPDNVKVLQENWINVIEMDFLKFDAEGGFSKIVANPPFTKNQDIDHVLHMYKQLSKCGRIVSIMSTSWVHGSQKKQVEFREWLDEVDAEIYDVDSGEFKESGTNIATKIVVINKV